MDSYYGLASQRSKHPCCSQFRTQSSGSPTAISVGGLYCEAAVYKAEANERAWRLFGIRPTDAIVIVPRTATGCAHYLCRVSTFERNAPFI